MIIVERGSGPLLLCLPHAGSDIPPAISTRLSATGRLQTDLSWRLEQVFDIAKALDATIVRSTASRYVIDVNVSPELSEDCPPCDRLCPLETRDSKSLYKSGEEPGPVEIDERKRLFYDPFHQHMQAEINRLRRDHHQVLICDCQSSRSRIRGYVEGELPEFSIGTQNGRSCSQDVLRIVVGSLSGSTSMNPSVDGRFQGGFIAEKYGQPDQGMHALSLVLTQKLYLRHESPPFEPDKGRMARLRTILLDAFSTTADWLKTDPSSLPDQTADEPSLVKGSPFSNTTSDDTHQKVFPGYDVAVSKETRDASAPQPLGSVLQTN